MLPSPGLGTKCICCALGGEIHPSARSVMAHLSSCSKSLERHKRRNSRFASGHLRLLAVIVNTQRE